MVWFCGKIKHVYPLHTDVSDNKSKFQIILQNVAEVDSIDDFDPNTQALTGDWHLELHVLFRGKWAEKCQFMKVGSSIMLKGLCRVDYSESEGSQMNNSFQFKLVAEDTNTQDICLRCIINDIGLTITSESLDGFQIPQLITPTRKRKIPPPAPVQKGPAMKYHKLSELMASDTENSVKAYNIYGVITSYSHPRSTKGKDFVTQLSVTDESETTLDLVLFFPESSSPVVHRIGDVVRIHRFQIVLHKGKLQGNKMAGTALLLFDTSIGDSSDKAVKPYRVIPAFQGKDPNYTFSADDARRVSELACWGRTFLNAPPQGIPDPYLRTFSELEGADSADLYCRIIGFEPPRSDGSAWSSASAANSSAEALDGDLSGHSRTNHLAILVWDGTDLPPSFPQQTACPSDAPATGSILRVACSGAQRHALAVLADPTLTPCGAYVRLRHAVFAEPADSADPKGGAQLDGVSVVMVLPEGHAAASQIERDHQQRESAAAGAAAAPATAVVGPWGSAVISPLREVLARAGLGGSAAAGKFRCRVSVVGYEPGDIRGFLRYARLQRR